ncbi:retroelement pol poly [Micractinium conductrix]|uniref:Retroelement pol poly n=1 Tax=Micractinium conductrix TaxID=554055 RepID=A0A2P6V2K7_9CHLO|nr:retroelement pol poly [Micractinium conductrix]|eukprot:PSC68320.1 retroelement pol poly [Micractinium conductrix]
MTWLTAHAPVVDWGEGTTTLHRPQGEVVLRSRRYHQGQAFAFMSMSELQQALLAGQVERVYLSTVTAASDDEPPPAAEPDSSLSTGRAEVDALLDRFKDVLRATLPDGKRPASRVKHHIREVEGAQPPPLRPPIRMSPHMEQELRGQIERLLENGRIRPGESPYGAPCFLVKKKGKDAWRMVIDYRVLNSQTVKWVYPVPSIDEMLDRLAGAKWFTTLDLTDGYLQIEMADESIRKTGFRTRWGQWEFTCMPFGLCIAPATFQAMMSDMLPKLGADHAAFVLAYLDDLIVFSTSLEEHLRHLERVLELLLSRQLYCKPQKCCFASQRVSFLGHIFLGHIVSDKGIEADGEKVAAVLQYPPHRNVRELQTFLGATGWFRRFIPRYAHRATPLTRLLKQTAAWVWGAEEQNAFEDLRRALTEAPVLVPPDHNKDWLLYTDASDVALGAVVLQETDEGPRAVAYLSKTLSPAERN